MALVVEEKNFTQLLRVLGTNVDGRHKVMYALTRIRGIGRRFSNLILKAADIDLNKRAGELTEEEVETLKAVLEHPETFDIPKWFLNRQHERLTGKWTQAVSNQLDTALRTDYERMKKIRLHRGLRHYWLLRVRGQHTKTTGRRGKTVGVAGKK